MIATRTKAYYDDDIADSLSSSPPLPLCLYTFLPLPPSPSPSVYHSTSFPLSPSPPLSGSIAFAGRHRQPRPLGNGAVRDEWFPGC